MEEQKQPNKINFLNQSDLFPEAQQDFKPEPPNKHYLPKWSMILLIVVGIVVIGLVGYFCFIII